MTNEEAVDIIRSAIARTEWDYPMECAAAFDKAIEALERMELQEAKTVDIVAKHNNSLHSGICPTCGKTLNTACNKNFCGECGQALTWT